MKTPNPQRIEGIARGGLEPHKECRFCPCFRHLTPFKAHENTPLETRVISDFAYVVRQKYDTKYDTKFHDRPLKCERYSVTGRRAIAHAAHKRSPAREEHITTQSVKIA